MEIKKFINLTIALAKAEFKIRNEGSYLGILWYLLNPIMTFFLLFLVFSDRLGKNIINYPLYLLIGVIMFNFFQRATIDSTKMLYGYRGLIRSIKFPYEALIFSIVLRVLFSHIFEIIIVLVALLYFKGNLLGLAIYAFLIVPFIIFIFGVTLILSSLTIYFRDLENIWEFVSKLIWLATPIFYSIGGQTRLFIFSLFNPMYHFVSAARSIVIYSKIPEIWVIGYILFYSIVLLIIGLWIFKKLKNRFAELM